MAEAEIFDWSECLERIRRQDQAAARDLVERLYPQVVRIVRARLPRRVQEEDLAQEVFMKIFTRLDQYHGPMPFTHWVSRIAVTTCIDQLRAQKRRPEFRWADLSEKEAKVLEHVSRDGEASMPGSVFAARELVEKLLSQLKPEDQLVVRMLDLEQCSVKEISEATGWNGSLVKVRAFRARRKLRKLFELLEQQEKL